MHGFIWKRWGDGHTRLLTVLSARSSRIGEKVQLIISRSKSLYILMVSK